MQVAVALCPGPTVHHWGEANTGSDRTAERRSRTHAAAGNLQNVASSGSFWDAETYPCATMRIEFKGGTENLATLAAASDAD